MRRAGRENLIDRIRAASTEGVVEARRPMAQKARKELAKNNARWIRNLHLRSLLINVVFIIVALYYRRASVALYTVSSLIAAACHYGLYATGSPSYVNGQLKSSGDDLDAEGLMQYMWDVIWVTWGTYVTVMIFGNWGWWLWVSLGPSAVLCSGY